MLVDSKQSRRQQRSQLFSYRGLEQQKTRVVGLLYAVDKDDLSRRLAERNIYLLSCRRRPWPRPMNSGEMIWLLDQLQLLLQAGLPVPEALRALQTHAPQRLQAILAGVLDMVESGYGLAAGLKPYLCAQAQVVSQLIKIGEQNGQLPIILEKLVAENRHSLQIKQNIIQSLAYPIMLSIIAVCIVSAMMVWVIPEFKKIYAGLGASLPIYTTITIQLSEWLTGYGGQIIVAVLAGGGLLAVVMHKHAGTRWLWARASLSLPFFGKLQRVYLCRRFAGHLRIIYHSGVSLNEAFAWLTATSNQAVYCLALKRIHQDLSHGHSLQHAIHRSGFFPTLVEQMITSGENSGSLEQALARIETFYGANLQSMASQLPRLLEPILIVFIAIAVAWILVSLYLPIFNLGFVL